MMRNKVLFILSVFLFLGVTSAKAFDLGLFVSDRDLTIQAHNYIYTYSHNPLFFGGDFFYNKKDEHDSWLLDGYLTVEGHYNKKAKLGLGFETMAGKVEPSKSYDILAIGFRFQGEVDLSKIFNRLPFSLESRLFYSPPILSFDDTKRVLTLDFTLYFYVNTAAAVGLRYEILDVDINKPEESNWSSSTLMLGAKIIF